jgi:nitrogen regulatory protein PII
VRAIFESQTEKMKKIEAVILPSRVDAVRTELERRGIHAMLTLTEVQQAGVDPASKLTGLGTIGSMEDRMKVELIVGDRQAQRAMEIIMRCAQSPPSEVAGHVSLLRVDEALQILPRLNKD